MDPLGASTQVHVSIIYTEENPTQSNVGTLNPSLAWLINPHKEHTYLCQAWTAPVATLSSLRLSPSLLSLLYASRHKGPTEEDRLKRRVGRK